MFIGAACFGCVFMATPGRTAAADPLPASDEKWRHYQSSNFELYSRESDRESRELLHNLELLRVVFSDTFKLPERRRLEVTIFLFNREKDFQAYLPPTLNKKGDFTAYYSSRPDRALIALGPTRDAESAQQTIFHEYIHHLVWVSGENPPPWLNEGMAEIFSTVVEAGANVELGRPVKGRLFQMGLEGMLPLEHLFSVDHNSAEFTAGSHTGMFYAESWALMHYWLFGQSDLKWEQASAFIGVARDNPGPSASELRRQFQEIFGMDYSAMEKRLEHYVGSGRYYGRRAPLPKIAPVASYETRPVSAEEARLRMAELAVQVKQSAQGKLVLLDAASKAPTNPRPWEVLGSEALRDGDERAAREHWQQALDAGSRNPAIFRELGRMETNAWMQQFDLYFRLPAEKTERLRDLLGKSIAYSPDQTDAYEMLAWVEAFSAQPMIRNVNLVQARFPMLVNRAQTLLMFAIVRHHLGDNAAALAVLTDFDRLAPPQYVRYGAEALRAKIEDREMDWHPGPAEPATQMLLQLTPMLPPKKP